MGERNGLTAEEFGTLVSWHYDSWYRVAKGRVKNREEALDLVQEALVIGFEKLKECRTNAAGWITTIILNLHRALVRKRTVEQRHLAELVHEAVEKSTGGALDRVMDNPFAWLKVTIAEIPACYDPLIQALIEHEGDTVRVAEVMGVSTNNVRERKRRLRRVLEESLGTEEYLHVSTTSHAFFEQVRKIASCRLRGIAARFRTNAKEAEYEVARLWLGVAQDAAFVVMQLLGKALSHGCDVERDDLVHWLSRGIPSNRGEVRNKMALDYSYLLESGAMAYKNAHRIGQKIGKRDSNRSEELVWNHCMRLMIHASKALCMIADNADRHVEFDNRWKGHLISPIPDMYHALCALDSVYSDRNLESVGVLNEMSLLLTRRGASR